MLLFCSQVPSIHRNIIINNILNLITLIISARQERHKLEGGQLDAFIREKYRSVITGETVNVLGEVAYTCSWIHEKISLCKRSYSFLFGISKNRFDECSKAFKAAGTKFITEINHSQWNDDHIHKFTFAETEQMIKENLGLIVVGRYALLLQFIIR